ncbi:MAG TPA: hypothetical protein VIG30_12695 [Ktedonobacterales bacterium]|jgi:hypothetical protein
MATSSPERDALLQVIAGWPVEDQVIFAREVLQRAAERSNAGAHPDQAATVEQSTWDALYGIASSGQEPPSDEQVAQWLDEHRMEKYGG